MNLTPFCSIKGKWKEPWLEGGYRYATNAAIIVRVPHATDDVKKSNESEVMDGFPVDRTDWIPWPLVQPRLVGDQCYVCMNDIEVDESKCPICGGIEHVIGTDGACLIGSLLVRDWFCFLISALPGVTYLPVNETSHWIRFEGGEGRIMGLKPSGEPPIASPVDYARELLGAPDGTRWKLSDGRCLLSPFTDLASTAKTK